MEVVQPKQCLSPQFWAQGPYGIPSPSGFGECKLATDWIRLWAPFFVSVLPFLGFRVSLRSNQIFMHLRCPRLCSYSHLSPWRAFGLSLSVCMARAPPAIVPRFILQSASRRRSTSCRIVQWGARLDCVGRSDSWRFRPSVQTSSHLYQLTYQLYEPTNSFLVQTFHELRDSPHSSFGFL